MIRKVSSMCLLVAVLVCVPSWRLAEGSSSGLNNIPTTDVVPQDILVLQSWLNSAHNTAPQEFIGFKYGPFKDVEIGVDWKANDRTHGHGMLQAKYAFDIYGDKFRGVLGFADLSDNRKHNGEFFPFVATSLDIDVVRLHFGYAPQPHNERFFAGIDKTFPFLGRNLQLKADAIQYNDKNDTLFSVGFLYELGAPSGSKTPQTGLSRIFNAITKNLVLESWVSLPDTSAEDVYTVKLNYVIKF